MAKLPGKRSKTRRAERARLVAAQREYVEKVLSKRQASHFRKLTPAKQKEYADTKLTPRQKRTLNAKAKPPKGKVWGKRPLPEPRRDIFGRQRISREQQNILREDVRKLRSSPNPEDRRRAQFIREMARQGVYIRGSQVKGFQLWGTIARGLKSKDLSPKGPKARALVLLGLRDPDWTWDVGSTPRGVRLHTR